MLTEQDYTAAAEQYLDMVYRIALNWFKAPADAEDAAQNVMLRLWRTDTAFQSGEHLRRWLARVTVSCTRRSWICRGSTECRCTSTTTRGTPQRRWGRSWASSPPRSRPVWPEGEGN